MAKASQKSLSLVDSLLDLVNSIAPGHQLKYNKHYIGLSQNGMVDNFVSETDTMKVSVKIYADGGENFLHTHQLEDHGARPHAP